MALLNAFRKQAEKKPCTICGKLVTRGLYRSHLNGCKMLSDDDDCVIVAEINAEDRRREAAENPVNLDSSGDLFETHPVNEQLAEEQTDFKGCLLASDKIDKPSAVTNEPKMQMAEIQKRTEQVQTETVDEIDDEITVIAEPAGFLRKRPKKIDLSKSKRPKKVIREADPEILKPVGKKSENFRAAEEITSSSLKHCSVDESLTESHCETRKTANVAIIDCEPTTSREIKAETGKSLAEILQNIKSYLSACECELAKNFEIPTNNVNDVDNGERIGSPYYLTLFHKILKRVICSEGQYGEVHFWGKRLYLLEKFITLSDRSKQLLIRLFLRKRKWLIAEKLSYADISSSLKPLFEELFEAELVDSSYSSLLKIDEAIYLLHAPSLKVVAKQFKLDFNQSKSEICRSVLHFATQKNVFGITMEKRVLHKIKEELGPCFRLRKEVLRLFSAILTLYSPMDMSTTLLFDQPSINLPSQLLFVLLQLNIGKIRFPAPRNPKLIKIYTDAEKLFRYVKAKELEAEIAELMQRGSWAEIIDCARKARVKFEAAYSEQRQFYDSLAGHFRRFTDLHVYARCISRGVEALERVRDYSEAVVWLEYLLYAKEFQNILCNARGGWWDRLALNLDAHLKDKDRAMKAIHDGLEDVVLGEKDRLLLQDRGLKLRSKWKGPLEVTQPERVNIKGTVLGKNLGEARINRFLVKRNGVSYECNVEEVALDHYVRKKGFKEGIHAEGGLWHTIFGLLFYDIIFDVTYEDVWFSETQMNPADLNSRAFYTHRQDLFELRFKEIEEADFDDLLLEMEQSYNSHYGITNSEIAWDCFTDFEQIRRFMMSCPISVLCATVRRLITDYRNCRSGFPDLTVWNDEKKLLAVVEVKGPGDKLSTKQRLWLNFFQNHDLIAHVCHVSARNPRNLD